MNRNSIGICYIGGVEAKRKTENGLLKTQEQMNKNKR